MRYERVKVKRDLNTVHNREVAPWEIPVLEFIFEDGNIEPQGEFITSDRAYPDAAHEFDRLSRCYGSDSKSGIPYVASVYGNGSVGVRALRKAIEASSDEDRLAEAEKAPVPALTRKRGRPAATADSLLG